VDGKPLFLVYKAAQLPDPLRTTDCWRDEAHRAGVGDLFLARVESHPAEDSDPHSLGFDAAVQFSPDWRFREPLRPLARFRRMVRSRLYARGESLTHRVDRGLRWVERLPAYLSRHGRAGLRDRICRYDDLVASVLAAEEPAYRRFPCVCPGWDNTARRQTGALLFTGSTPDKYEGWLRAIVDRQRGSARPADPIFVNAWNEWAEGCHLEPCQRWGRAYLEATARALGHPLPEADG
jgi:hypothetical protein